MLRIENQEGEIIKIIGFDTEVKYEHYFNLELKDGEGTDYIRDTEGQDVGLLIDGMPVNGKFEIEGNVASFYRRYIR